LSLFIQNYDMVDVGQSYKQRQIGPFYETQYICTVSVKGELNPENNMA